MSDCEECLGTGSVWVESFDQKDNWYETCLECGGVGVDSEPYTGIDNISDWAKRRCDEITD